MKVLFTSPILTHPAVGGPALRIENSIKALARVAELHVVCRAPYAQMGSAPAVAFYQSLRVTFSFLPGKGRCWQACESLSRRRLQVAPRVAYLLVNSPFRALGAALGLLAPDEAGALIRYARKHQIEIIWFGYGNISFPLIQEIRRRAPGLRLVCDTDSVWSRYILRELSCQTDPEKRRLIEQEGRAKEQEEQLWVNMCDATTAVSEVDAAYYRSLAADPGRVRVFSNVIDFEAYRETPPPAGFQRPCVYLAGSFWRGSPMEHAARWVTTEVLPLLRREWPGLHLYIVGSGSDMVVNDLASRHVTVAGRVESVLPYLCNADVVLVPLWFESGTRFKILEAGACRKAVVSTTLGAEGVPVKDGEDILLADTPGDFASAIARVLGDPALSKSLGQRLFELISASYSIGHLAVEGPAILNFLAAAAPNRTPLPDSREPL